MGLQWLLSSGHQASAATSQRRTGKKDEHLYLRISRMCETHRCCCSKDKGRYISARQLMRCDSSWSAPASIIALHKWICCFAESIQIQFTSPVQEAKGAENGLSLLIYQFVSVCVRWGVRNDSMIWLISKVRLGDALLLKAQTLQYNYKVWEESSLLIQTLKIITCTPHAQEKLQWDGSYWLRMNEKGCKGHKSCINW